jgi:hypothetical protein
MVAVDREDLIQGAMVIGMLAVALSCASRGSDPKTIAVEPEHVFVRDLGLIEGERMISVSDLNKGTLCYIHGDAMCCMGDQ